MLRLGIELMQPDLLMQQALGPTLRPAEVRRTELSLDVAAAVERVADLGFDLIELNPDLMIFFPQCFNLPSVERLRALRESRGLGYTLHLPLWSVDPSTPVQPVRRSSLDALVDGVLRMAPLEPEVYVLHATGALAGEFGRMAALEPVRPLVMRLFQEQARRSVKRLLDRTGLPSRLLALENVEFPLELTLELAEEFDLSVCLDTGHVLAGFSGDVTLEDALRRTFPRLTEVHLHDAYRRTGADGSLRVADHLPLGEGDLAVEALLARLEGAGFEGPVIFELTVKEALASLEVIRALRPDFLSERTSVMSITIDLLDRACHAVHQNVDTVPFRHRGIKITRELIRTAMELLNAEPTKTLPQNCRNAVRAETPDGLDRRIKESLNIDTRTANIVSDVLAQAGIVRIVRVRNPRTGRLVKGTQLLADWSW
jgi:sugar phosphate isomerase/epimerase